MPEDSSVPASLAYRKNQAAILRGDPPQKYLRLLPYIPRTRVVEIGAAEGVLSLLMADAGKEVTAVELREDRHQEAVRLQARWKKLGRKVDGCRMVCANIIEKPELFQRAQTLVAVRVMYHLRDQAQAVILKAAEFAVPNIILCGNKNRATRFQQGRPHEGLGPFNYFATIKGMSELLTSAGYSVENVVDDGDPIVTGKYHPSSNS